MIAVTQFAGAVANDASVGTTDWVNLPNALSSNDTYTTNNSTTISHYLKGTDFSFPVPSNATIVGVKVYVECKAAFSDGGHSGRRWTVTSVRLVNGGVISGDDAGGFALQVGTTESTMSWGASDDLWGLSLSPSDVNASNFGFVISAEENRGDGDNALSVDSLSMAVYYTIPGESHMKDPYGVYPY